MSTFIGMGVKKTSDEKSEAFIKLEKENKKLVSQIKELTEINVNLENKIKELTEELQKKADSK